MSTSTKPIDSKTKKRYAELIGLGLSHREAAGATGISERSGERLMAAPQYRKIAEETEKRGRGMEGELGRVIRELLEANDEDGNPNYLLRDKGAELVHRYPDAFAAEAEGDVEELLPHGIFVVYPRPPDEFLEGPAEE
jgi:hypothetical protein